MAAPDDNGSHRADDLRLYVQQSGLCRVVTKTDWNKEYCFLQHPGENHFHLLVHGEVFVQKADERYCLNCAFRLGLVTHDRQFWQKNT